MPQTHSTPTPGVLQDVGAAQHPSPQQGQPHCLGIHPLLSSAGGRGLSAQQQSGSGQWRALLDTHTNTHTHFIKNKIIKKIKSNQKKQKKKKAKPRLQKVHPSPLLAIGSLQTPICQTSNPFSPARGLSCAIVQDLPPSAFPPPDLGTRLTPQRGENHSHQANLPFLELPISLREIPRYQTKYPFCWRRKATWP